MGCRSVKRDCGWDISIVPIFSWEQKIIEIARSWPQQGPLFQFMYSSSDFSITIYFIIIGLVILTLKMGWRPISSFVIFSSIAVLFSELVSRRIIKALVMRPRPNYVGLECHMSSCWGFISSHATNIFSVAVLFSLYDRRNLIWTMPIAVLVSFSRVYLLDHFPLDVIGGALAGTLVGFIVWGLFQYSSRFVRLRN